MNHQYLKSFRRRNYQPISQKNLMIEKNKT